MSFNPFAGSAPSPQRDKPNQTLFANCIAERVQNSAKAEDTKAKYIRAVELLPIIIGKALEEIPLDLAGIAVELTDKALQRLPCSLATAKQYRRRILGV